MHMCMHIIIMQAAGRFLGCNRREHTYFHSDGCDNLTKDMANATSGGQPRILLGIMTSPLNPRLRTQWREWASLFKVNQNGVDVRFVVGKAFHNPAGLGRRRRRKLLLPADGTAGLTPEAMVRTERDALPGGGDFVFVEGREKLPHVGKVTEKSASWWLNIGRERPGYDFYCKADDDTLVHLDRLHHTLAEVRRARGPDAASYFGHIKWRGWDVGHRFQACGGGWGPARKTGDDIAKGGTLPGGHVYPPCPYAAGPYPYMSGGMVCMSSKLQRIMAEDGAFRDFYMTARERNNNGVACRNPQVCAAQPSDVHMWHHEDAGVGFNVFRAVAAANATASLVPVPGHFNDNGIIERTTSAQDRYWSTRAIFVHGIKGPAQYQSVRAKWRLSRPDAYLGLRCFSCESGGTNGHNGDWTWARLPCAEPGEPRFAGINASGTARHCPVKPAQHFGCCGWPWVVPELRDLIVSVLRQAPGRALSLGKLHRGMHGEMRKLHQAQRIRNPKGCVRDCLELQLPGAQSMSGVLRELANRKDLVMETREEASDDDGLPKHAPKATRQLQLVIRLLDRV